MPANGYPVTFRQLGGSEIEVELGNAFLPTRGVGAGIEQRGVTRTPPGADEPLYQGLGPEYMPMDFEGELADIASGVLNSSYNAHVDMERIAFEGVRVEMTWGDVWRRVGIVESYVGRPSHDNTWEWELTFRPHTAEQPQRRRTEQRQAATQADLQRWLNQAVAAANESKARQLAIAGVSALRLVTA